jgi:hypothetical protein
MTASTARTAAIWICGAALAGLAGCEKPVHDDMSWAQGALERNARLEVLTVDRQARAFTVRMKDTGELRVVQADDIVGSPPQPANPANTATAVNTPSPPRPEVAPTPEPQTPAAAEPAARPVAPTSGPGVISSGPGYSIKSARPDGSASSRSSASPASDSIARGLAVERRDEPIVCQGVRFLRIDNRNLEFSGDAISAEDGCEIHITNSRIAAQGVGVSARAANVHIENSSIEGQSGSLFASDGAQVYAEASHFRGLSRGLTTETLHDLGGNVWN